MPRTDDSEYETVWTPIQLFDVQSCYKYAVVVLNRPIQLARKIMLPLWERAEVTVTVDGGTDQWMKRLGDLSPKVYTGECAIYAPTLITGDMDSSVSETREKLSRVGSKVVATPDQSLTDYTKAIYELAKHCESRNIKLDGIYVIVDTSGRLDQLIGNLNTLYSVPELFIKTKVIEVASNSLTWLLQPGRHKIIIPEALVRAQSWCGLLPLSGKVDNLSSTGLKWNLDNVTMEFGGLISTSNTYEKDCTEVTLVLHDRIVWTMGIEPLLDSDDVP